MSKGKVNLKLFYFLGFLFLPVIIFCSIKRPLAEKETRSLAPLTVLTSTNAEERIFAALKPKLIDGSRLSLRAFKIAPLSLGDLNVLHFSANADDKIDYVEFYACLKDDGPKADDSKCQPSKERPESFVLTSHGYFEAPAGELEVGLRACARADKLLLGSSPCGPWQVMPYTQVETFKPKLHELFVAKYEKEKILRTLGRKILNAVSVYLSETAPSQTASFSWQIQTLARNLRVLGEDILGELLLKDYIFQLEASLEEAQKQASSGATPALVDFVANSQGLAVLSLGRLDVLSQLTGANFTAPEPSVEKEREGTMSVNVSQAVIKEQLSKEEEAVLSVLKEADLAPHQPLSSGLGMNLYQFFVAAFASSNLQAAAADKALLENLKVVFRDVLEHHEDLDKINQELAGALK